MHVLHNKRMYLKYKHPEPPALLSCRTAINTPSLTPSRILRHLRTMLACIFAPTTRVVLLGSRRATRHEDVFSFASRERIFSEAHSVCSTAWFFSVTL